MRSISILQDIQEVLRQLVIAIPEVFLSYDVDFIDLNVDDEDRPTVWEIVFVESSEFEVVLGQVTLLENFEAHIEIYAD
jgi:hypothetical protein